MRQKFGLELRRAGEKERNCRICESDDNVVHRCRWCRAQRRDFGSKLNGTPTAPENWNLNFLGGPVLKRAVTIVVLAISSIFIWIGTSPVSLQAHVLTRTTTVTFASTAGTASGPKTISPRPNSASAAAGAHLTAPVALLLQGMVFLACGSFWPKKKSPQTALTVTRRSAIIGESAD